VCNYSLCDDLIFTEHSKIRLQERVGFKNLLLRINNSKELYLDRDSIYHIYLGKSRVEVVARMIPHKTLLIITVIADCSLSDFREKRKSIMVRR